MKFIYHEKIGYVDPTKIEIIEVLELNGSYDVCYGPFAWRQQVTIGDKLEAENFALWLVKEIDAIEQKSELREIIKEELKLALNGEY